MTTSPPIASRKAFGVLIGHDPRAVAMMRERYAEADLDEARLRMARIPDGAELIANPISKAPGFMLEQCHRHGRRAQHHAGDARQCRATAFRAEPG